MIIGLPLEKQPAEIWSFGVNFAAELGVGETISSAVFRAVKESDGSVATTDLAQGAIVTATSPIISQTIKAGVHGESYMLEIKATTSLAHVWEAERRLIVLDIPVPAA